MSSELRATYRVQLHAGFTLDDAAGIVSYLADLGISHLYCSPYLQAAPGSMHGYDVVDHRQVNQELGGEPAQARLVEALQTQGMSQVLDIVPNHMSIASAGNPWWRDVLEHGPSSRYASYFDVDWDPPEARHSNEVLIPVLGDHYGRVLEAGEICLALDDITFAIHYYDNVYPLDPASLRDVLLPAVRASRSDELAFLAGAFGRLPSAAAADRASADRRYRDSAVLHRLLQRLMHEQPEIRAAVLQAIETINQDHDALDQLLQKQNYRLVFWRMAGRELGYRRFFDINTLIGLHMEDAEVFRDTHTLPMRWVWDGLVDGLRVDHPDGLLDPEEYFQRLRAAAGPKTWIVLEKILEPHERLPQHWPVAGTVGYDFLHRVNQLLVDPAGEAPLTDYYARFTGQEVDYPALVRQKKLLVLDQILGSDINRLTYMLLQITGCYRRYRDYTLDDLRAAIMEVAADLPVYRTYLCPSTGLVQETDAGYIAQALAAAKANRPDLEPQLFDFLADLLLLRLRGQAEDEFVLRFQQMTGPAMAKGVEDTVFYTYYRLVSLNEVGGDPSQFGLALDDFHRYNADMAEHWPLTMLSTATHDTKRSDDVRARLNVLSELPAEWAQAVERWAGMNKRYRRAPRGERTNRADAPSRNDEYLLYQTLVGAWPVTPERVQAFMQKAAREAKQETSWTRPNPVYEQALSRFVQGVFKNRPFLADLQRFVAGIVTPGRINALAQTLLKLTAPGVPDIYQGSELWDLSLVDPDNRRPVDYALRRRLLAELEGAAPEAIWAQADSGLPKLWVTRQALALRRQHPEWFGPAAGYRPLAARGAQAGRVVAYLRGQVAVIVPRFNARPQAAWDDTLLELPAPRWRNHLTGETFPGGALRPAELFARFPVALLAVE